MKKLYFTVLLILILSYINTESASHKDHNKTTERKIVVPEFQTIMDTAYVKGAILIYDLKEDTYYSNNFEWTQKGKLPASTFKIPNSIIALETDVVENDHAVFKWKGEKRSFKSWEQDLTFKDAFHFSCVPCYQEVARKIGVQRMVKYVDTLNYGNMKIDTINIDLFWLEGASRINQLQQIDFLKRFYLSELPISERTETILKRMMVIEENDTYQLSGKTGWSISNGNNNGWFVGYIESKNKTYIFATNVEPKEQFDIKMFPMIRKDVTFKAFEQLKIIE